MIVALIVFPVVFLVVLLCVGLGMAFFESRRKSQVRQILWTADAVAATENTSLVRGAKEQNGLPEWLDRLPIVAKITSLLCRRMSNGRLPGFFLRLSLAAASDSLSGGV